MSIQLRALMFLVLAGVAAPCPAQTWELPADRATVPQAPD